MAFKISGFAAGYEYRRQRSDVSKKSGKAFTVLTFECVQDGSTLEVSTTDTYIMEQVKRPEIMKKGYVYNVPVVAISGRERSYIMLTGVPAMIGEAE